MNWRQIKTADDRDAWHFEQEKAAVTMAEIARDIWKDKQREADWWASAEYHRRERWPKDRTYQPIYNR